MYIDAITIVAISITSAFVSEGLSWVLIYRTQSYKSIMGTLEKQSKKLEKEKDVNADVSKQAKQNKKVDRVQSQIDKSNKELSMIKTKSMFFVGLIFVSLVWQLGSIYGGIVVAKLPFVPFGFIQGMSHRNIEGEDYTDCAFIFIYVLSSMAFRSTIQKLLGFAPPRNLPQPSMFGQPPMK
eukprot:Nk52_evm33s1705 gene=Nk52_evmTU33s1705